MDRGANIHSTERVVGRAFVLADATSDESSSSRLEALQIGGARGSETFNTNRTLDFTAIKTRTAEISSTGNDAEFHEVFLRVVNPTQPCQISQIA